MAFLSDRSATPQLWVQDVAGPDGDSAGPATVVRLGDDPVVAVRWSADGQWLACTVAPGGGVRTEVWVARPDGTDVRLIAGGHGGHATLGPWSRSGHRFIVTAPPVAVGGQSRCDLVEPATGVVEPVAAGGLVSVLDISPDERFALLRDGRRGAHYCVTLDRHTDRDHPLLPYPGTGSTESGLLRPSPSSFGIDDPTTTGEVDRDSITAYLVTDAGRPRAVLAAVELGPEGVRGEAGILAERADAELERFDADDAGTVLALVWNAAGRSELELLDPATSRRRAVPGLPGQVITGCVLARDGRSLVVSVESPSRPQRIWRLDLAQLSWRPVTDAPPMPQTTLVEPELHRFTAADGLPLTGWLYRAPGSDGPGPMALSFHGGPEAQERPVFSPNHQGLLAAGISVFAPNVRGSSGFGRAFAHADDRYGRYDGIEDVRSCVSYLTDAGLAEPGRIAVTGRSYGGYLTLAAMVRFPELFAGGVDICGMSDLTTFYRDTEPWIGAAAISKYGDPRQDRTLLEDLSPLRQAEFIGAPLLVVHGEHDTNVPLNEARQIVAALRALRRPVQYLELPGEGHEYRFRSSRITLLRRMVDFLSDCLLDD